MCNWRIIHSIFPIGSYRIINYHFDRINWHTETANMQISQPNNVAKNLKLAAPGPAARDNLLYSAKMILFHS